VARKKSSEDRFKITSESGSRTEKKNNPTVRPIILGS
jgi:hypothetical protein